MLLHLHVKNLALIREAEIDFAEGLNILTGETGAGKSILIGSMTMALGGKVSKEMIREDADYALAELIFETDRPELLKRLSELEIPVEDGQVILSRKLSGSSDRQRRSTGQCMSGRRRSSWKSDRRDHGTGSCRERTYGCFRKMYRNL